MTKLQFLEERLSQPFGTDCVEWPFATNSFGYGLVGFAGGTHLVTHIALASAGSPRPDAPHNKALHRCDNPPCFNPNHLEWNTQKRNVEQMVERGRKFNRNIEGVNNPRTSFTEHDIRVIFAIRGLGFTHREIAELYDCYRSTVGKVLSGKTWGHLGLAS